MTFLQFFREVESSFLEVGVGEGRNRKWLLKVDPVVFKKEVKGESRTGSGVEPPALEILILDLDLAAPPLPPPPVGLISCLLVCLLMYRSDSVDTSCDMDITRKIKFTTITTGRPPP